MCSATHTPPTRHRRVGLLLWNALPLLSTEVSLVREDVRHLRIRHLVGLVGHAPALVVVEAQPRHITEHDDDLMLSSASDEFVRHLMQFVFDRSGFLAPEAFDDLRSQTHLRLS